MSRWRALIRRSRLPVQQMSRQTRALWIIAAGLAIVLIAAAMR